MDSELSSVLMRDVNPDFIETLTEDLRALYDWQYDQVASSVGPIKADDLAADHVFLDATRKMRRNNGILALRSSSQVHGIPFELKRLTCNGQMVAVAQLGQVLLLQEPIDHLQARPVGAEYKSDLAASHFAIRQLEMDLGDGFKQRIDSRNTLLAIIQHGMHGDEFSRRSTALSMMRIVVPDVTFGSWLFRANILNDELAYFMEWKKPRSPELPVQEDRVYVHLKSEAARAT